ncbi:hypothetical protein [Paenibacillus mesophilus]|nr:hypothetical protein [Paenibacillus mesophilus]
MKFGKRMMTAFLAVSIITSVAAISVSARTSSDITILEQCYWWLTK